MRRLNKTLSLTTMTMLTTLPAFAANTANQPNILVIMADDLMSAELGCYGGKNVETPNIDKLAKQGLKFNHCYASTAMSVPIRGSLYTGLYPAKHGAFQNHKHTFDGVESVLDYLPPMGYRVGRAGKTHFSSRTNARFDLVKGFTVNCVAKEVPFGVKGVTDYINKNDNPFLLYVCSTHPHAPWTWGDPSEFNKETLILPDHLVDSPEMREIYTKYLAEIKALDIEVGAVMKTLEESGKLDNTLVIFLGEQGAQFPGCKWTLWHSGVNSAMIARFPQKIKAGATTNAIVQYEDILPTIIDVAGGNEITKLDGESFRPVLYGKSKSHREYAFGIHNNIPEGNPYPIRSIRDDRYSLILNLTPEVNYHEKHLMAVGETHTGVWAAWNNAAKSDANAKDLIARFLTRPAVQFYDKKNDPLELNNLADNPKHVKRIAKMRAELERWMKEQGDTGAAMDVKH